MATAELLLLVEDLRLEIAALRGLAERPGWVLEVHQYYVLLGTDPRVHVYGGYPGDEAAESQRWCVCAGPDVLATHETWIEAVKKAEAWAAEHLGWAPPTP